MGMRIRHRENLTWPRGGLSGIHAESHRVMPINQKREGRMTVKEETVQRVESSGEKWSRGRGTLSEKRRERCQKMFIVIGRCT